MTTRKMPMGRVVTRIRDHTPSNTDYTYDKRGGVTRVTMPSGSAKATGSK